MRPVIHENRPGEDPSPEWAPPPGWAKAFAALPRSLFLPDLVWAYDMTTGRSEPVSRTEDPAAWERTAAANVPVITQWDDGNHTGKAPGTVPTSSASMPSLVAGMLRDLDVHDDARVLEIGTGTGWNAALLAHRLGGESVTTVEIDPAVATRARAALHRAGLTPEVITGNGAEGHPESAPYDRVIVTAGVRAIPPPWLEQTAPGGLILLPWGTHYSDEEALVRLVVGEDGHATGPFLRPVGFMRLRDQRLDWDRFRAHVPDDFPGGDAEETTSTTPLATLTDRTARFVAGLHVPDCAHVLNQTPDGTTKAWFFDLNSPSWAAATYPAPATTPAEPVVHQSGPRHLWTETEQALTWWTTQGNPPITRFGLTVTPDGTTTPWFDHPSHTLPPG